MKMVCSHPEVRLEIVTPSFFCHPTPLRSFQLIIPQLFENAAVIHSCKMFPMLGNSIKYNYNNQLLSYVDISFAILKSISCHIPEKSLSDWLEKVQFSDLERRDVYKRQRFTVSGLYTKKSDIKIIQTFQNMVLCSIVDAPW